MANSSYSNKEDIMEFEGQILMIPSNDLINEVITVKEACAILGIAESTLKTKVIKGEFSDAEYRKTGGTLLFSKKAIEERLNKIHSKRKGNTKKRTT